MTHEIVPNVQESGADKALWEQVRQAAECGQSTYEEYENFLEYLEHTAVRFTEIMEAVGAAYDEAYVWEEIQAGQQPTSKMPYWLVHPARSLLRGSLGHSTSLIDGGLGIRDGKIVLVQAISPRPGATIGEAIPAITDGFDFRQIAPLKGKYGKSVNTALSICSSTWKKALIDTAEYYTSLR